MTRVSLTSSKNHPATYWDRASMSPEERKRRYEAALSTLPSELRAIFRIPKSSEQDHALSENGVETAILTFIDKMFEGAKDRVAVIQSLPRGLQIFYLSFVVEAEVMNGGFNQYFWNPWNQYADLIATALRELGDPEAAQIFEEALEVAIAEIDVSAKFRRIGTLDAFSQSYQHTRLTEFDGRFCERAVRFPAMRLQMVRSNEPVCFL